MNTTTRRGWALGAAALVSLWGAAARADDTVKHGSHHDSTTGTTSREAPDAKASAASTAGTTRTTGADYDARAGAERSQSEARPNRTLLVTGGAVLAGSYLTSAIAGVANDRDADRRLLIPVIGPWADLADRQCDRQPCEHKFWDATLLVASGVLQAGGLATVIAAFFVPESETPSLLRGASKKPEAPSVHVVPMSMGQRASGAGIGAVGRF
jgi:hypothetical protein